MGGGNSSLKLIFTALLSFTLILSFNACSDGDDNGNQNPALSPTTVTTESVTTSGTVSSSTVTVGATTTVKTSADGKSYYEFTESTSVSANIFSRTVTVDDTKGGTWKYFENEALKYTGTYKGDISDFSEVLQDNTTSEGLKLELTVTEVANDSGDLVEVTTSAADATFEFVVESATDTSSFTFVATIPAVEAKKTETPAQGDAAYVTITYPTATELAGKNFLLSENSDGSGSYAATYKTYLSFSNDGTSAKYISFTISSSDITRHIYYEYKYDSGKLYEYYTDYETNEKKLSESEAYTLPKVGSKIYLYERYNTKLPRTEGSGLTATFGYETRESREFPAGIETAIDSKEITLKSDGTFTGSAVHKRHWDYTDGTTSDGGSTSTLSGQYVNDAGIISFTGSEIQTYLGESASQPYTSEIDREALYDGTRLWLSESKLTVLEPTTLPNVNKFFISYNSSMNGSVQQESSSAAEGETIEFEVCPYEDCEVKKVSVTDEEGNALAVYASYRYGAYRYKYTFTMPKSDVVVSAEFMEVASTKYTFQYAPDPEQASVRVESLYTSSDGGYSTDTGYSSYSVSPGKSVVLLITTDAKYNLDEVTVTGSSGTEVSILGEPIPAWDEDFSPKNGGYQYICTFVMPEADVTVTPTFTEATDAYKVTLDSDDTTRFAEFSLETPLNSSGYARAGTKVVLYVSVYDAYELVGLAVRDSSGNDITLTKVDDNHYSFTMPASAVIVTGKTNPVSTQ